MTALSNSLVIAERPSLHFSTGSHVKSSDRCLGSTSLAFSFKGTKKSFAQRRALVVQASYSDGGRPSSTSVFVGGFLLGGLIAGTLGCVYAPQISNALISTDKKDLMKKLPKFIYDEEKAVENRRKQRKKLAQRIEELNSAIDNVSNQFRSPPTEAGVSPDDIEAVV
ncbi:hypothetical protein OROMI_013149 [Orobanche minor]